MQECVPAEQQDDLQSIEGDGVAVRQAEEPGLHHQDGPGDGREEDTQQLPTHQHAAGGQQDVGPGH